jgi:polyhydroxyalkanoate synthesis regulator phasin
VKKQRYQQFTKEIEAAVKAGKLSKEEAADKLSQLKREMFEQERHDGEKSPELEAKKRRYEQAAREIKEAHAAGKLSEEEAERKLDAVRHEMFETGNGGENSKMEASKKRYERLMDEMKAAVEAGKLSEEEAKAKLIDMKRKIFEGTP